MNLLRVLLWGFAATTVLSIILSGSRSLHLTRMDFSYMLGALVTPNRDRAKWLGFIIHFFNGWVFALIYAGAMASTELCHWWFGAAIGAVHASFVLVAGMALLPAIHPRMATEFSGPDTTRQLEPPGFMALNYGRGTPAATVIAHLAYGAILGAFVC